MRRRGARMLRRATGGGGSSLPPGVTLQDPDGGMDYYDTWSNAGPLKDDTFFPIAAFAPYDLNQVQPNGMTRINGHVDAGINTYVHLGNGSEGVTSGGTDIQALVANGNIVLMADPTQPHVTGGTYLTNYGSKVVGWSYQDEAEGMTCASEWVTDYAWLFNGASCSLGSNGKVDTQHLLDTGNYLRGQDTSRLVYQGYTNGFCFDWFVGGPVIELAQAGDVIGYDVYVLTDTRSTFGGQLNDVGKVWSAYTAIQSARANAQYTKPIWPDLETDQVDTDSGMNPTGYNPTDAELTALPWHYIIGGARGILWFQYCFCGAAGHSSHDVINDTTNFPTRHNVIKAVNAKVQSLAHVMNSQFALGYVSSASAVNYMAKWVPAESAFYIFAAIKQATGITANFTIAGSPTTTATVLFESRTVNVTSGAFSDSFTGNTGWHVYKITV